MEKHFFIHSRLTHLVAVPFVQTWMHAVSQCAKWSYRVRVNQYWQSSTWNFKTLNNICKQFGLLAKLNSATLSDLNRCCARQGKTRGSSEQNSKVGSLLWLQGLPWYLHTHSECPVFSKIALKSPRLPSHYSMYWSLLEQAKQISFWLKTEVTGGKLKSLIVICSYWGAVDVSIQSPVTFANPSISKGWCAKWFLWDGRTFFH